MNQYHIDVVIRTPDGKQHRGAFNVPAYQYPVFNPYDRCASGFEAMVFDGVTHAIAEKIDRDRNQISSEIAKGLTKFIMDSVKSTDTENGYTKEENQAYKEGKL